MTARARFRRGEPVDDIGHRSPLWSMTTAQCRGDRPPRIRSHRSDFRAANSTAILMPARASCSLGKDSSCSTIRVIPDGHADGHSTDAVTCGNSYTNGVWARQECFWRRPSPCAQDPQSSGPRWSGLDRTYRQSPHPGAPPRRACNSPTQPSASGRLVAFWSQELENLHDVMSN